MAGGLLQISACGAQDVFLTGNPDVTYFKTSYRRHTNFSKESVEQGFSGTANFGKRATAEIPRNGDMVTNVFVKMVLPEVKYNGDYRYFSQVSFAWVRNIGNAAIADTTIEVGGSTIDTHYGEWMQIWQDLSAKPGQQYALDKMLGNVPELTEISYLSMEDPNNKTLKKSYTLYSPLQFFFCRNNGLALPLIALQYHNVKISVRFRPVEQLIIASDAFKSSCGSLNLDDASLYITFIYLDNDERSLYAKIKHDYLIEQLQHTEESLGVGNSAKHKLGFNHPVKALYWVVKLGNYQGGRFMVYEPTDWQKALDQAAKKILLAQFDLDEYGFFRDPSDASYLSDGIDYESINPASQDLEPYFSFYDSIAHSQCQGASIGRLPEGVPLLGRKGKDLRDKVEGIISIHVDPSNDNMLYPKVDKILRNDLTIADLSIPIDKFEDHRNQYIKNLDLTVWLHDNYGLYIDGTGNPSSQAEILLNGQSRQSKRAGSWYDTVEPYLHHTKIAKDGLNMYSFALHPESHQPSCTCNFSRIDSPQLSIWFNDFQNHDLADVFVNTGNKTNIYAVNYNIFRTISGMGGLGYAS